MSEDGGTSTRGLSDFGGSSGPYKSPSETADGRIVPVDVGEATIRLQGLQFHTPVIFAEENEPSLLGVVSLGEAALAVDPLARRLIPTNLLRLLPIRRSHDSGARRQPANTML